MTQSRRLGNAMPQSLIPSDAWIPLFRNTAEALQAWGQKKTGNVKLQIAIANTLISDLISLKRLEYCPRERDGCGEC
jgi:hypothetical protein